MLKLFSHLGIHTSLHTKRWKLKCQLTLKKWHLFQQCQLHFKLVQPFTMQLRQQLKRFRTEMLTGMCKG